MEIEKVKTQIIILEYQTNATKYTDEKTHVAALKAEQDRATAHLLPLKEKEREALEEKSQCERQEKICLEDCKRSSEKLKELSQVIERSENQYGELCNLYSAKKKSIESREKSIRSKRMEIENDLEKREQKAKKLIETGIMGPDGTFNEEFPKLREIAKKLDALGDIASEQRSELESINTQKTDIARKIARLEAAQRNKTTELLNLDNIRQQKLHALKQSDPQLYKAITILHGSRDSFEGRVYEPLMLELSVKDSSYADILEATMNYSMLSTFVCEKEQDYYTLRRILVKDNKLRVNVACPSAVDYERIRNPMQHEKVRSLGFECLAFDQLVGPEPVLAYACSGAYLDSFAISRQSLSQNVLMNAEKELTRFSVGQTSYTVRRAYGTQSVQARLIKRSRFFLGSVDQELKRRLENELEDIHSEISTFKKDGEDLEGMSVKLMKKLEDLKNQRVSSFHVDSIRYRTKVDHCVEEGLFHHPKRHR
jgi:tellurite resistance protein